MTHQFSHIKEDVKKDIETLEREADRARAEVESTLEALEWRLSPTELIHRAVDAVRDNGGDFAKNLATQVRNNPVPAVLAGLGVAWLMASSDRPPRQRMSRKSSEAGQSVGERMSSAAESTRDATAHAARSTRAAARGVAHRSRAGVYSVRDGYDYLRREQPLVLGALGVAAGAALGALLPATAAEDEWIGETSDDARERIRREGRRRVEAAKAAAAGATEAAADAATEAATAAIRTQPRPAESPPVRPTGAPPTR